MKTTSIGLLFGLYLMNAPLNAMEPPSHVYAELEQSARGQKVLNKRLIAAAKRGDIREVSELLALQADPNAQDEDGYTPLMFAAGRGDLRLAEYLIAAGADKKIKSFTGQDAYHMAPRSGPNGQRLEQLLAPPGLTPEEIARLEQEWQEARRQGLVTVVNLEDLQPYLPLIPEIQKGERID